MLCERELVDDSLVFFLCNVGEELIALATTLFAVLVALVSLDCFGFFLGLSFVALLFADEAASGGIFFAQFASTASVGAFDDCKHSHDLVVGFDLSFFRETGERVDQPLDGGDLHDDDVVVRYAFDAGIIGGEICEDGFEFGLVERELRVDGAGGIEWVGCDRGELDDFGPRNAMGLQVGFEEVGFGLFDG